MNRRLEWGRRSLADLRGIASHDARLAQRIGEAVTRYAETNQGDVRKLAGSSGIYRLRVGDGRVLFTLDDHGQVVAVSRVLNRRDAYRG